MEIPHVDYFRNLEIDPERGVADPQFGRRLAEALKAIQRQARNYELQANLNPTGQPSAPPNIQSVTATGANGFLHVAIEDQSAELSRGVNYYVEHSAFPDFRDAQVRNIGDARAIDLPIGNATRYVRAYSAYPGSPPSAHVYHGSPVAPLAVQGGGAQGPPAWLPSQGSGTGAPGQVGVGPGPLPRRTAATGVQWTGRAVGGPSGPLSTGLPVSPGGATPGSGGGGGGGGGTSGFPIIVCTQATFPTLTGLGPTFIYVTDYVHMLYWDGTDCNFTDGGNCFIAFFDVDPGTGWHLLDGTVNVKYLKKDGTTGTYTVEDAGTAFYLKASTTNSGPNAAVAPTISGVTDDATVGFTGSAASAGTASINNPASGTPTTVLVPPISGGGGSLNTDPHHHPMSVANAPISATGEPRNIARRPFFRQ